MAKPQHGRRKRSLAAATARGRRRIEIDLLEMVEDRENSLDPQAAVRDDDLTFGDGTRRSKALRQAAGPDRRQVTSSRSIRAA